MAFSKSKLDDRKQHFYPPYSRLVEITIKHIDKNICREVAEKLSQTIRGKLKSVKILGPGEPMISKIRNEFLMTVLIKVPRDQGKLGDLKSFLQQTALHLNELKEYRNSKIIFDVDPV